MSRTLFELIPPVVSRPVRILLLGWAALGVVTIIFNLLGLAASGTLSSGPEYYELTFSILLLIGAIALSLSSIPWPRQTTNWKLEVLGWPPAIAAWLFFCTAAITDPTPAPYPIVFGVSFLGFSIYRLIEVLLFMKVSRWRWESVQNGKVNA